MAHLMHVQDVSVYRWESPYEPQEPPLDAWKLLDSLQANSDETVRKALTIVHRQETVQGAKPQTVQLTYYRSQKEYDSEGRDPGFYGMVNAKTRRVGEALTAAGYQVHYTYPDDPNDMSKQTR